MKINQTTQTQSQAVKAKKTELPDDCKFDVKDTFVKSDPDKEKEVKANLPPGCLMVNY